LPPIEVYFSPEGGCTEAVVREIDAAQSSILIQAYSLTSTPIAKAVVAAYNRGVHVEVILDRSDKTEKYSEADYLHNHRVPVLIDSQHAIAHNKVIIIDGQVVITGSFNFTKQAEEHNAENLLVIRDKILADQYTANWKLHADHSEEYAGRKEE
jgi:phosphatidylserine/phosphatidylglycerophosphate/cardiolipin synthase-like enzyme